MITDRKLNIMSVNSDTMLFRILMWRERLEFGDNPAPIMVPSEEESPLRNGEIEAEAPTGG